MFAAGESASLGPGPSLGLNEFSLPEFMNLKLFGKTILVVNIEFGFFWAIHSASETFWIFNSRVAVLNIFATWVLHLVQLSLTRLLLTCWAG